MATLQNKFEFLDNVLKKKLPFLASYLERVIGCPFSIVTSPCNFPATSNVTYHEPDKTLYYPIGQDHILAYIIIRELPSNRVSDTISILLNAQMAFQSHFSDINPMIMTSMDFEKLLLEHLFQETDLKIITIMRYYHRTIDGKAPYYAAVMKIDQTSPTSSIKTLSSLSKYYFNEIQPEIITLTCSDCLIFFVPACMKKEALPLSPSDISVLNLKKCKEFIENKLEVVLSLGIGRMYPLESLRLSFKEARIALTLNSLMGKKGLTREFSQLGIYYFIFSLDIGSIRNYCLTILGPLMQYDSLTGSELLLTLREISDCNFNSKSAADNLFLHINTVHYRLKKIEQLLNLDLSVLSARTDIYTAIKVWDILLTLSTDNRF